MNTLRIFKTRTSVVFGGIFFFAAILALVPFLMAKSGESGEKPSALTTVGGDGNYQTTVERKTEGELSEKDFRQVSLLASRVVKHVNSAAENLADEEPDKARKEVGHAQTLVGIIRKMLPVTAVTTVVKDGEGKEVYRNVDHVQNDDIPIFEKMIAVEVVEPIADVKKEEARLKGLRLSDADLLRTSVLLDLDYVERRLARCEKLLKDRPADALANLILAQHTGIRFVTNKEDNPLVEAQSALRIAQRMAESERYEAAKANLQIARNHLELYQGLVGKSADERVKTLDKDIDKVMSEIEKPDTAKQISGFWNRLTGWFKNEAGQTRSTEAGGADKEAIVKSDDN